MICEPLFSFVAVKTNTQTKTYFRGAHCSLTTLTVSVEHNDKTVQLPRLIIGIGVVKMIIIQDSVCC